MDNFSDVRDDGTLRGTTVETHLHLAESISLVQDNNGKEYIQIIFDCGGYDGAVRVPIEILSGFVENKRVMDQKGSEGK